MIKQYGNIGLNLVEVAKMSKERFFELYKGKLKHDISQIWKEAQKYKPRKRKESKGED